MEENKKFIFTYKAALYFGIFFTSVGLLSPFFIKVVYKGLNIEQLAQTGDWLGGSSAPYLGLASFLLIMASVILGFVVSNNFFYFTGLVGLMLVIAEYVKNGLKL